MREPSNGMSLEEFKARLPIAEIIGRHVRLVRRGREFTGLCPFHQEKTPSFTISEEKGFYHCFGCNQSGNAVDFIMAIEGLDFGQAVLRCADLTGLPPPIRAGKKETEADKTLHQANDAAARWYAGCLSGPSGKEAQRYLEKRGLEPEMISRFGLGYAPSDRRALKRALIDEGFTEQQLVNAGLLIRPDDGGACYDRFRHRVMFPIHDRRGRVVGFGGRALGDARAKYLNTPDTELFHKGELLYGLPLARTAARAKGTVVVAEGYMDVIALARAGFENAVAPLGTAVTEAQLALLWQLADEPIICLDGDEAGLRAGHRLIERALPHLNPGKSLRFAVLPKGSDPDDLVQNGGPDSLDYWLQQTHPLLDFLWDSETRQRNLDTPERQAALRNRLSELSKSITNADVRRLFREAFRQQWQTRFPWKGQSQRSASPTYIAPDAGRGVGGSRLARWINQPQTHGERELLGPLVVHSGLLPEIEEELGALEFVDPTLERLRQEIISWYSEAGDLDQDGLSNHLCTNGFTALVEQLTAAGPATVWYDAPGLVESDVLDAWRLRAAEYRRWKSRRMSGKALAEAVAGDHVDLDEARVQGLTIDHLVNKRNIKKARGGR
ncbi:MAG: DNA primase [Geminicoccaceae bacterium]